MLNANCKIETTINNDAFNLIFSCAAWLVGRLVNLPFVTVIVELLSLVSDVMVEIVEFVSLVGDFVTAFVELVSLVADVATAFVDLLLVINMAALVEVSKSLPVDGFGVSADVIFTVS